MLSNFHLNVDSIIFFFTNSKVSTVEARFNEGPEDWQSLFAISRFFFIHITITGVKKIVRYTKDFVIYYNN